MRSPTTLGDVRLIWGCVVLLLTSTLSTADESRGSFRIAGYLPDYRIAEFDADAAMSLTDLILFSGEPTAAGGIDLGRLKGMPWARLHELKVRHRLKLILCVGGWGRSKEFAVVAASREARDRFVQSAVRLCRDQQLDGLDLDWEHPQNDREQANYARLLGDLRDGFRTPGLLLSVTVAAWQPLAPEAVTAVDRVQLMAYDNPGRHSTFEGLHREVTTLLDRGVPREKLVVGLPFYGRHVTQSDRTLSYADIVARHRPAPDVDEVDGLFFNGPNTIRRKTRFAVDSKLAGVMVWELGQDVRGDRSLLTTIRSAAGPR